MCVCVRARVGGQNELEVCTTLAYPHITLSVHSVLTPDPVDTHKHMHTCILKPFEDSEPMGLKVDIAVNIYSKI